MREQTLSRIRFEIQVAIDNLSLRRVSLEAVFNSVFESIGNIKSTIKTWPDLAPSFEPILAQLEAKRDELNNDLELLEQAVKDLEELKKKYDESHGIRLVFVNKNNEEIRNMKISVDQSGAARIKLLTSDDRPASFDGKPALSLWKDEAASEPSEKHADLVPSEDGLEFQLNAKPGGDLGEFFVKCEGDVRQGEDVLLKSAMLKVEAKIGEGNKIIFEEVA